MRPGDLIGHYRLERDLGAGSFATVWLARDELLDATVAIKILADNWARNADVRRRFIDEARILRRIDHDRIIRVFAVDELATGQPMFVMAFADRGTLTDRIAQRQHSGRHSIDEAVATMIELCQCLGVVHAMGIVHRDLKPSNVLFRSRRDHETGGTGDVMLLADFGLAKDLVVASGFTLAAGTPAYMAPEQAHASASIDQRTDVYAASAILYELLTGRPPSDAATLSGVGRRRGLASERVSVARSDVPAELQAVIDTGMCVDPNGRYPDVAAFAAAIVAAVGEPASLASSVVVSRPPDLRDKVAAIIGRLAPDSSLLGAVLDYLAGPVRIGVVDPATIGAVESIIAGAEHVEVVAVETASAVDVIVVPEAMPAATLRQLLPDGHPGPIAALTVDRFDELSAIVEVVGQRRDAVLASAGLAFADAIVRNTASPQLSKSWMESADAVERLRVDVPAFNEMEVLRAIVAGKVLLPAAMRAEACEVLLGTTALHLDDGDAPNDRLNESIVRWREFDGSGRVTFGARQAVDTVIRSLERLYGSRG